MREHYFEHPESVIHLPSHSAVGAKVDVPCSVTQIKGKRLHLISKELIPARVPLSVEHEDALYLGEVIHCILENDEYSVDIEVEQVLTGLQSLVALRARLLDEQSAYERTPEAENVRVDRRRRED